MMNKKKNALLGAAVAGILTGVFAATSFAGDKASKGMNANKKEVEHCYGINSCKGTGQCGGKGHACAGQNTCAGQGWINVEKGHCKDIKDGSVTPAEAK
jgi:uncharacterized membrane protein